MYETLSLDLSPREAALWFGLFLGLAFGVLAQVTRFCLRRALVGPPEERSSARGVWFAALAVAILGTQGFATLGWVDFGAHRFHASSVPVLGIAAGGLMFGLGAVLTRGCISRLTVLAPSGNLRALVAMIVFAIAAHATLQGVLAPLRQALAAPTMDLGAFSSLAAWPGGAWPWSLLLATVAVVIAARSAARPALLAGGAAIGVLAALGWAGTGYVLYDEFDPIALESLSFTAPWATTLFWSVAASLTSPGFGVGLIGGVLVGAAVAALATGRFALESFESPQQTVRTLAGAALMGIGGVMAGGCTVGAGLAGVPSLSIAAMLALGSIAGGMFAGDAIFVRTGLRNRGVVPAE